MTLFRNPPLDKAILNETIRKAALGSAALLGLGCLGFSPAFAGTTLDYSVPVATTGGIGSGQYSGAGETFTVGSDNILQDFGFSLEGATSAVEFNLTIAPWNGTNLGPALFQSAPMLADDISGAPDFYTFATGGLSLIPGRQYAAYISPVYDGTIPDGLGSLEMNLAYLGDRRDVPSVVLGKSYSGGAYLYFLNGRWNEQTDPDFKEVAAFHADFTSVPVLESSTTVSFGLLMTMGGCMVTAQRKRLRRRLSESLNAARWSNAS